MPNTENNHQSNFDAALLALTLDRATSHPLHVQVADALRQMILSGNSFSGARLPASRTLAAELSVSRMTITTAYDQLTGEGYLTSHQGRGTFVANDLPHLASPTPQPSRPQDPPRPVLPFHPGIPDPAMFPHRQWARYLERAWRAPAPDLLARPDPFGWYPLRTAISDHLSAWRGLACTPAQIIVTGGAWDAFDILCNLAFEPGQIVATEDPGWATLRHALLRSGVRSTPLRVDAEGMDAAAIPDGIAAAITTPSRHYPTGVAMPLARRLALLEWAQKTGGVVIEDDYDSEFRYQGQPLPSLSGLDGLQHTVYLGSFSKLLSPALRLGYLVVPEAWIKPAQSYLTLTGSRASLTPQPALAAFMGSGDFAVHLRRMRRTYAKRQSHLVTQLAGIPELLEVRPDPSGMHLYCPLGPRLSHRTTDQQIAAMGQKAGLYLRAISSQSVLPDPPQGLLLGYAAFDEDALTQAAQVLIHLLRHIEPD